MDWDYPHGAGPEGIFEIGSRLAEHIGRIPDATTFTHIYRASAGEHRGRGNLGSRCDHPG